MKRIIISAILISICACSSNKSVTASNAEESKGIVAASVGEKDGSTIEKAIVIKARSESDGVGTEYRMLEKMFPKYKMKSQGTSSKGSKSYDVMSIVTADNVDKVIYFDITNFYGKF